MRPPRTQLSLKASIFNTVICEERAAGIINPTEGGITDLKTLFHTKLMQVRPTINTCSHEGRRHCRVYRNSPTLDKLVSAANKNECLKDKKPKRCEHSQVLKSDLCVLTQNQMCHLGTTKRSRSSEQLQCRSSGKSHISNH